MVTLGHDPAGRRPRELYPRRVLDGLTTALVLFAAAFHGRQDAIWIAKAGMNGTCVDIDAEKLEEMKVAYPAAGSSWTGRVRRTRARPPTLGCGVGGRSTTQFQDSGSAAPVVSSCAPRGDPRCRRTTLTLTRRTGGKLTDVLHRSELCGWGLLDGARAMLTTADVTACLVTRGDQPEMMRRIIDSLIFDQVIVWDNSERPDGKTAGRFYATLEATHPCRLLPGR